MRKFLFTRLLDPEAEGGSTGVIDAPSEPQEKLDSYIAAGADPEAARDEDDMPTDDEPVDAVPEPDADDTMDGTTEIVERAEFSPELEQAAYDNGFTLSEVLDVYETPARFAAALKLAGKSPKPKDAPGEEPPEAPDVPSSLQYEFDEELGADADSIKSHFENTRDYFQSELQKRDQQIQQLTQAIQQSSGMLTQVSQNLGRQRDQQIEGWFGEQSENWKAKFGDGELTALDPQGPQYKARVRLVREAAAILNGNPQASLEDALTQARNSIWTETVKREARDEFRADVKKAAKKTVARPQHKKQTTASTQNGRDPLV